MVDTNTTLIIVLLCVNIVSGLVNNVLAVFSTFLSSIQKSRCCNSEMEMKKDSPPDIILDKVDHSGIDAVISKLSAGKNN